MWCSKLSRRKVHDIRKLNVLLQVPSIKADTQKKHKQIEDYVLLQVNQH